MNNNKYANINELPCFGRLTGYLLLSYKARQDAVIARDKLWAVSKNSTSERMCSKCNTYHLFDSLGLPVESKEKVVAHIYAERIRDSDMGGRKKCPVCISATGEKKTVFTNLVDAQNMINSLKIDLDGPQRAYDCPEGHGIHLTKLLIRDRDNKSTMEISQEFQTNTVYEIMVAPIIHIQQHTESFENRKYDNDSKKLSDKKHHRKDEEYQNLGTLKPRLSPNHREISQEIRNLPAEIEAIEVPKKLFAIDSRPSKFTALLTPGALTEFIYKITTDDVIRLNSLIKKSNTLSRPQNLPDQESILKWANTNNPIEAYFLAEFTKIPHQSRNFSDNTLESKLKAWLDWAVREKQ
jgi:hypothetical protein